MSRRDGMIAVWHEVPGTVPPAIEYLDKRSALK
jgi:hypothetical protein